MRSETNKILAQIFRQISAMYNYMGGNDRFRAIAYAKAAKVIEALPDDISKYEKKHILEDLPGIGESISAKITEFLNTGKIKKFELLKTKVPVELLEMAQVSGFGPQTIKRIHQELNISTKEALIEAIQNGSLIKLKGFGTKKIENLSRGLKIHKAIENRMLLWDALEIGEAMVSKIKKIKGVKQVELAGSLRRRKETIGDFDILVSCQPKDRRQIADVFSASDFVKEILVKGDTKVSVIMKENLRQVDMRMINEDEWGAALQYFTGSKEHNIHLRSIAKQKGLKISEYGLTRIKDNKKVAGISENEIYEAMQMQMIPPELREDRNEFELAQKNMIPDLLSIKDIKGDMQVHSVWSDGLNTIDEIADYVKKNFSYEYLVITDHSKSSRIANGMNEKKILEQIKAIDLLNKKSGKNFVKKGIEVDILPNGLLDVSNEILSQLDWVTACIHSNFNRDNTFRLLKACENPYVNCIGHPTGRLIGSREAYHLDIPLLIKQAKDTRTALEINAQPNRMDLNDEHASLAISSGVKLVICTDSHSLANFDFMKLGVFVARRAGCTADNILNTQSWKVIESFRHAKLKKNKI